MMNNEEENKQRFQEVMRASYISGLRGNMDAIINQTWVALSKKNTCDLESYVEKYKIYRNELIEEEIDTKRYDEKFKNLPWGDNQIPSIK